MPFARFKYVAMAVLLASYVTFVFRLYQLGFINFWQETLFDLVTPESGPYIQKVHNISSKMYTEMMPHLLLDEKWEVLYYSAASMENSTADGMKLGSHYLFRNHLFVVLGRYIDGEEEHIMVLDLSPYECEEIFMKRDLLETGKKDHKISIDIYNNSYNEYFEFKTGVFKPRPWLEKFIAKI